MTIQERVEMRRVCGVLGQVGAGAMLLGVCVAPGTARAQAGAERTAEFPSVVTHPFNNPAAVPVTADNSVSKSTITVSGMPTDVSDVNVTVSGITADPDASTVHIRLESPLGRVIDLMSDACTMTTMTAPGTTYVFDDEAAVLVPETLCPTTGSFQPTDYLTVGGGPPPAPNIATLSMFDRLDPNGTWTLYALSTNPVNASVTGGWSISFETPDPPPDTVAPDTTITHAPSSGTRHRTRVGFTSDDPTAHYRCRRDHGRYRSCSSPRTLRHLALGKHVFRVTAVDGAGNVDPTPAIARWRVRRRA